MPITQRLMIAWAAGFIDGEGCIGIYANASRDGRPVYRLSLTASQHGNDAPLERLLSLFGGSITQIQQGKAAYWGVTSKKAADAIREMLPYLTVKRKQAELALEFQSRKLKQGTASREDKVV